MNQTQIDALHEIERQLAIIWAQENPPQQEAYIMQPEDNLQNIIDTVQQSVIDLNELVFTTPKITIVRPVQLFNGSILATSNVNDMIDAAAENIILRNIRLQGDNTTKRGIVINDTGFRMYDSAIMNIRRQNTECQAIASWNGDDAYISNTILQCSTQSVLIGGSTPIIPNHVPTKMHFDRCLFTRPIEWLNAGWGCKTIFEVKSGRDIKVTNSILENMRTDGQTGIAVTLTGSQYGNSPLNIVENVEFNSNTIRNVSTFVNAIGWSQHQNEPGRAMLKGNNYRFINNICGMSQRLNSGQGALAILGRGVDNVKFIGNTSTMDGGDAFLRFSDNQLVTSLLIDDNTLNMIGTYGVFGSSGSRGTNWINQANPGAITNNRITGAHSIFRANFPNNVYS